MKRILHITLIALIGLPAFCQQDAYEEIRRMNLVYNKATSYKMDITIESLQPGGASVFATQKAKVAVAPGRYFADLNGVTTIVNDKYTLTVDENNKTIVIGESHKQKKQKPDQFNVEGLVDSLMATEKGKLQVIRQTSDVLQVGVDMEDENYKKVTYQIDPRTHYLKQVVYYLKNTTEYPFDRLRITYLNISVDKRIPESTFSVDRYVSVRGSKVSLSGAYSSYKLINNIGRKSYQP